MLLPFRLHSVERRRLLKPMSKAWISLCVGAALVGQHLLGFDVQDAPLFDTLKRNTFCIRLSRACGIPSKLCVQSSIL